MPNHYHLLVRTPEANVSRAIQWLNGGYGICPAHGVFQQDLHVLNRRD
jgi:REP element-mobilizing transposase RayT